MVVSMTICSYPFLTKTVTIIIMELTSGQFAAKLPCMVTLFITMYGNAIYYHVR